MLSIFQKLMSAICSKSCTTTSTVVEQPIIIETPAPLPRIEFTDADGNWEWERSTDCVVEVRICDDKVYFKIKGKWVVQEAITSVRFYK